MSQRAENNFRLELYRELDDIVSAMKNLAQVELHRVNKAESNQAAAYDTVAQAMQWLHAVGSDSEAGASAQKKSRSACILLGSERGFCGGFNEQIARAYELQADAVDQIIVVGGRLVSKLPSHSHLQLFAGPATADEVLPSVQAIMDFLLSTRLPDSLQVFSHSAQGVERTSLLPISQPDQAIIPRLPQLNLAPTVLWEELQWQYLQQGLIRLLLLSLKIENRHRLQQMEGAREHLETLSRNLVLRINTLRQQEIVEEIEVILADQTWV